MILVTINGIIIKISKRGLIEAINNKQRFLAQQLDRDLDSIYNEIQSLDWLKLDIARAKNAR